MAGLLSLLGGNRAQGPGMAQQGQNPFQTLLDPQVALPMAAALMGNQGNMANFGNAFGAAGQGLAERQKLQAQTRQKNQTLELMRRDAPDIAQAIEAGGLSTQDGWKTYLDRRKAQKPPSSVQEFLYGQENPEFFEHQERMKRAGATNVQVGDGAPGLGKLSTDYGYVMGPDGKPIIDNTGLPKAAPIPGSPASQEIAGARQKQANSTRAYEQKFNVVDKAITDVLDDVSGWTAGPGGALLSNIPGTPAYDMGATIETIKANLGFEELQNMRDSSPTGGALGQVTERELAFLQAAQGNLDQAQTPEQLRKVLSEIQQRRREFREARRRAYEIDYGEPMPEPGGGSEDMSLDELLDMYGG